MQRIKIVEVATVTDEELERVINHWVERKYQFEGIQFAMTEASRRPAMAFVMFREPKGEDNEEG